MRLMNTMGYKGPHRRNNFIPRRVFLWVMVAPVIKRFLMQNDGAIFTPCHILIFRELMDLHGLDLSRGAAGVKHEW